MSFHEILIAVMAAFAVAGAIDRIFGNRWGLGKEFEAGILAMGSLALAMVGIVCLAPVLANLLKPVIVPVFAFLGADPAMFAGTILACDMGGGALAVELAASYPAAMLGGVLTGSMLGATVVFTIPVAMGILEEKDRPVMAKGILCGIVTVPLGVLAGGLTAGFPIGMVLRNLIPIVIIAALIALGLWRAENAMVRGFEVFGRLVVAVVTVGLAAAIVEALTGFVIIPGMAPISEGFETVGTIAIVLAGAFPLVFVITKLLRKPLMAAGAGHQRRRGGGTDRQPCQLHCHLRHGGGHEPAGQGGQHRLRGFGGLRLRRPSGLHGGLRPGDDRPHDRGKAGGRRQRHRGGHVADGKGRKVVTGSLFRQKSEISGAGC